MTITSERNQKCLLSYIIFRNQNFVTKSNQETIELLPLEKAEDCDFVKNLLEEFVKETDSAVAKAILADWDGEKKSFVKVFPYEYQRALRDLEEEMKQVQIDEKDSTKEEKKSDLADIESVVTDVDMAKRKDAALQEQLDKKRGFVKYKRESRFYRSAEKRLNDWDEIYDFKHVRRGLKVQAARCMDCGVPFCHSTAHGCPLGNIIPKFNDLVFNNDWKEALHTLLQVNFLLTILHICNYFKKIL